MVKVAVVFITILFSCQGLFPQKRINIWEGTSEQSEVFLTPYLVEGGESNAAIIVCPGGSYFWLDDYAEGRLVAEWLNRYGISAFVLRYRTAGISSFITHVRSRMRGRHPDMIRDVQKAICFVREKAFEYGVDDKRIGVMGFSSGGHLALSSGTFFDADFLASEEAPENISLRPDFVAAIYPVVTLSDERFVHKRSRRGLLGEKHKNDRVLQGAMSIERHVSDNCPPVFLLACKDDKVVNYGNSLLLDSALTEKKIYHRFILYEKGGHGFGADENKGSEESQQWKGEFIVWFRNLFGNIKLCNEDILLKIAFFWRQEVWSEDVSDWWRLIVLK